MSVLRLQHTSIPMPPDGHAAARRFYGETLGMNEVLPPVTLARDELVWFKPGDSTQEVHLFVDTEIERNSSKQHLCLQVENLDEMRKRLGNAGYGVEDTTPIHNRPRFFVHDDFDNLIEITQVTGEYK